MIRARARILFRSALLLSAAGLGCATTSNLEAQMSQLRDELSASRRAQENLRGRLERLEARVETKLTAPPAPVVQAPKPVANPLASLPVVRLEAPVGRRTGMQAPDLDTSIPLRDPADHTPVVFDHTVTDSSSDAPIDLNAVVARQAGNSAKPRLRASEEKADKADKADEEFQAAVARYNGGAYDEATSAFRSFAYKYPRHVAAAEALYMGGLAQVAGNRCLEAKPLFETVLREYPSTDTAGRALLAQAKCEANVGHDDAARTLFNRVVSEHPTSAEATLAKSALADLSAGHAP